jgi:HAMP domain-containing protein
LKNGCRNFPSADFALMVGTLVAISLAWWLARRLSGPIRQLEDGVQRIGAGPFEHRIEMTSGDELEQLANRFNEMAGELATSKEKSERINRLKRFLAPQVAELVEDTGNQGLLDGPRREVVPSLATCAVSRRSQPTPSLRSSCACSVTTMRHLER